MNQSELLHFLLAASYRKSEFHISVSLIENECKAIHFLFALGYNSKVATLLIRNVQLIDGVHDFPEHSDVFVAQGNISAIGNFPAKAADATLDGQGAYLAPGFIDVNTDSDHYLTIFGYPSQADFLKQGVTTIFGGMCGSSLAPLLYGSLEAIEKWGTPAKLNVDWHTMAEFLRTIDRRPLGVNFGTLVGHATIRRALLGDETRDLSKNEQKVFEKTVSEALRDGGFGISTGLGYVHGRETSVAELKWLAGIVAQSGGVYATHVRDGAEGVEASIKETIQVAEASGAKTLVSHFIPYAKSIAAYERALRVIESLAPDRNFRFDIYPFGESMLPFHAFLPVWAQGGVETMAKNVRDEWLVPRIIKEMPPIAADRATIVRAPGHEFLSGKTLADVALMYGLHDAREAFLRLMAATGVRGTLLYNDLDEPLARRALASPRSFVASNAPAFDGMPPRTMYRSDRTTSTFSRFLSLVQDEKLIELKGAIRKISYEPAQFFGLAGRGELREGAIADLTCFKGSETRFTIVNGKVAMQNGEFQNVFAGKALRKK
jgi:N-acyl-D-amino-acid deacylase